MKEVLQNAADRERLNILKYLKDANKALIEEYGSDSEQAFYIEMIIDKIATKIAGKPLNFHTRDLGL